MLAKKAEQAFTLAEVLLALAIIGVITALTIPAVITKVTKEQYVAGVKKAWNTIKAAESAAIREHGPMENWGVYFDAKEHFEKHYKEHFDIIKICVDTEKGCWVEAPELTWLNGKADGRDLNTSRDYRFVTSDGMAWVFDGSYIVVDVNGLKGPNRWGRDIFEFDTYGRPASIKPTGWVYSNADLNRFCDPSNLADGWGGYCAAKVLAEGAMNY